MPATAGWRSAMSGTENCLLTTKDFTIIEVMLERRLGRADPLAPLLRRKLSGAVVMFREDIPPTVVTLNSRVTFRVNEIGRASCRERVWVWVGAGAGKKRRR